MNLTWVDDENPLTQIPVGKLTQLYFDAVQEIRRFKAWDADGRSVTIIETRHVVGQLEDGSPRYGKRVFTTSTGLAVRAISTDRRRFLAPTGHPPVYTRVSVDARPERKIGRKPRVSSG